jgi:hypothetical protein
MAKVYISSTYTDLVEHRQRVYGALHKMRYDVIAMEDYVATDERPMDQCLGDVASCDIYIGIFAWRYGYIPPSQEWSITELEYRQAGQSGLECLIFLLDEDAPWPRSKMEKGVGGEKIEALRQELMDTHIVQFFRSPEELAEQVGASVAEWAQKRLDASMDRVRAEQERFIKEHSVKPGGQRVVNVRPLDVTHFRGRHCEIQAFCEYLADPSVRLVSVVGRGGMGKTALACRVLADLERGVLPIPGEEKEFSIKSILYLGARSTGLGLERIYTDVGRMVGEPAASALAACWASRQMPLAVKVETLLEALQHGPYLILLDNLEDYLNEEGAITEEGLRTFVERCLIRPSGVKLVVTSRKELQTADAALHSTRSILLHEGLPEDEAVGLLRDLDPQRRFGLRDAPEKDLRRAARLTESVPRALEILAGILHRDPTANLSALLANEKLFGDQVVEQLVAESYRRLEDGDKRVLEALAAFGKPVVQTGVVFVLTSLFPGLDVEASLRRLVNSYFVSVDRKTREFSLHPLHAAFALSQIPRRLS